MDRITNQSYFSSWIIKNNPIVYKIDQNYVQKLVWIGVMLMGINIGMSRENKQYFNLGLAEITLSSK
jgi:hypothetical protein